MKITTMEKAEQIYSFKIAHMIQKFMGLFKFQQQRLWLFSLMKNAFIAAFKRLNLEVEGSFY